MFAKVEIVDGKDREGNSVISEDMEDYNSEEGEEEMSEGLEYDEEEGEAEISEKEEAQPVEKTAGEIETSVEGNIEESPKPNKINEEVQEPATKIQKTD